MSRPPTTTRAVAWPALAATGIGSLPGHDPMSAVADVLDLLPDLPYLPELPARGVGADAVGRAAALLVDLPVEVVAGGWQIADRPGHDVAAARHLLDADMAALQVAAHGAVGPVKVGVLGPVSLAAALGRARGEAALADPGLRRDLASSLGEGVRGLLEQITQRLPGIEPVLQIDEPRLPAVLAGAVRTRSGWGRLAALDSHEAQLLVASVVAQRTGTIVHCCAADIPTELLLAAGAQALSFDLDLVRDAHVDGYAAAVDGGAHLVVGAVPTGRPISARAAADRVDVLWRRLGFSSDVARARTAISPACGLATVSVASARHTSRTTAEAARLLAEQSSVGGAG